MPPRYVYWTILIDNKPTAFRARDREDLLPTLAQLQRTNADVVMKWFARGRVWDSPEAERAAQQRPPAAAEKRGRDWRPGGAHKDPRDRFKKKKEGERRQFGPPGESRAWRDKPAGAGRPAGPPRGDRPWAKSNRPPSGPPRGDRPQWQKSGRPPSGPSRGDRPWEKKPYGKPQVGPRPWGAKAQGGPPRGDRPWHNKPRGPQGSGGRPFPKRDWRPRPPKTRNNGDKDEDK